MLGIHGGVHFRSGISSRLVCQFRSPSANIRSVHRATAQRTNIRLVCLLRLNFENINFRNFAVIDWNYSAYYKVRDQKVGVSNQSVVQVFAFSRQLSRSNLVRCAAIPAVHPDPLSPPGVVHKFLPRRVLPQGGDGARIRRPAPDEKSNSVGAQVQRYRCGPESQPKAPRRTLLTPQPE